MITNDVQYRNTKTVLAQFHSKQHRTSKPNSLTRPTVGSTSFRSTQ